MLNIFLKYVKIFHMKKDNSLKILIALVMSYFTIVILPKISSQNNIQIKYNNEYNSDNYCFATFNNRNVYISNEEVINEIINANDSNIYIIDKRDVSDPSMSFVNSYKITDKNEISAIVRILEEYNKKNPSGWIRTYDSVKNEITIHTIAYENGIRTSHTITADLNNRDEKKYDSTFLTYLLK